MRPYSPLLACIWMFIYFFIVRWAQGIFYGVLIGDLWGFRISWGRAEFAVELATILVIAVGISKRKTWATWLALAAWAYEVVSFAPAPFRNSLAEGRLDRLGMFKLAWLGVFPLVLYNPDSRIWGKRADSQR